MTRVHFDIEDGNNKIAQKSKNRSTSNIQPARGAQIRHMLNTNSFPHLNEGIQKEIMDAIDGELPKEENINMKLEEIREGDEMHRGGFEEFG